jgi:hypothetical protein
MQTREYFQQAHRHLRSRVRIRAVQVKCHPPESSLLEGILSRGDRRLGAVIEAAWRRGARFDAWAEELQPDLWWQSLAEAGVDGLELAYREYPPDAVLPWDHIGIRQGRTYLENQAAQSAAERTALCGAAEIR